MALTDNRTQLQDCENVNEVAGDSNADPQSNTTEAGVVIEGTTALQFQVTNAQEYLAYDQDSAGSTFNLDLSDSTIYMMVKDNLHDSFANLGGQCVLADTADGVSTTVIGYAVAGYDVIGLPYEKKYSAMKLDVSVPVAAPGTSGVDFFQHAGTEANLDQTIIKQVGYGSIHLIKGQGTIPNTFFDGIYYIANDSYAASITGGTVGTPETMADVVGDDITVGAGMFSNPKGSEYDIFAPTEWGAATGDTYFEGTDEQWIYLGDNGGGHAVGATHFPMRLLGGTGTNSFVQTRVTNINVGTRAQFDFSDANFDIVKFDGSVFTDFGKLTFPTVVANDKFVNNTTFNNCDQMDMSTIDSDGCVWNGTTDALGAIILDAAGDSDNILVATFNSDGTGHAVYITATGTYDFDNWLFNGYSGTGANAAVYNNSGGAVTINILNGGDTPSVRNGTSATTTVNNSVNVSLTGVTYGTPVKFIANETVGTITAGDVLSEGFADSAGTYAFTQNYEAAFNPSGLDVRVVARNQGVAVKCWQEDSSGPSFIDETADASSNATGDVALFPNPVGANDAFYIGHDEQFAGFKIDISTAGVGTYTTATEYWNGTAWSALTVTRADNADFKSTGTDDIFKWNIPSDWATTSVNSVSLYYIRIRYVSGTMTTNPVASKLSVDAPRYLPYDEIRVISSTGLLDNASWRPDTISKFSQT
jgi:hypothetical protein